MGKPLALTWCRKCVAAHPEGQHLSRTPKPFPIPKALSTVPAKGDGVAIYSTAHKPGEIEKVAAGIQRMMKSHPPQPVTQPKKRIIDQTVKAKKTRKAVMAAAITAETRTPVPLIPPPKRQKPFKDPAKELARRRRQKADQMKRYRAARAKRLAEQGLNRHGDPA